MKIETIKSVGAVRRRKIVLFCIVTTASGACASSSAKPTESAVRMRTVGTGPAHCAEVRDRARANPALDVEKLPTPLRQPTRLLAGPFPPGVIGANGYADVHVTVVVDTLGKPLMKTFKVKKVSHPWLGQDVKQTLARWTFTPAELEGCKVARVYKVDATSGTAAVSR